MLLKIDDYDTVCCLCLEHRYTIKTSILLFTSLNQVELNEPKVSTS